MCILLPTTRSIRAQTQTMQWMSYCLLLRKRMSSEALEEEGEWTQEDVQQISEFKYFKRSIFYLTHLLLHFFLCGMQLCRHPMLPLALLIQFMLADFFVKNLKFETIISAFKLSRQPAVLSISKTQSKATSTKEQHKKYIHHDTNLLLSCLPVSFKPH